MASVGELAMLKREKVIEAYRLKLQSKTGSVGTTADSTAAVEPNAVPAQSVDPAPVAEQGPIVTEAPAVFQTSPVDRNGLAALVAAMDQVKAVEQMTASVHEVRVQSPTTEQPVVDIAALIRDKALEAFKSREKEREAREREPRVLLRLSEVFGTNAGAISADPGRILFAGRAFTIDDQGNLVVVFRAPGDDADQFYLISDLADFGEFLSHHSM